MSRFVTTDFRLHDILDRSLLEPNAPSDAAEEVIRIIIQSVPGTDIQHNVVRYVLIDSDVEEHRRLIVIVKAMREQTEELRIQGCVLSHSTPNAID